jgi:hypothetical protein
MMGIFSNFNSLRKLLHPSFSLFGDKTASRAVPSYFPLIAPRVILYNQLFASKKILKYLRRYNNSSSLLYNSNYLFFNHFFHQAVKVSLNFVYYNNVPPIELSKDYNRPGYSYSMLFNKNFDQNIYYVHKTQYKRYRSISFPILVEKPRDSKIFKQSNKALFFNYILFYSAYNRIDIRPCKKLPFGRSSPIATKYITNEFFYYSSASPILALNAAGDKRVRPNFIVLNCFNFLID